MGGSQASPTDANAKPPPGALGRPWKAILTEDALRVKEKTDGRSAQGIHVLEPEIVERSAEGLKYWFFSEMKKRAPWAKARRREENEQEVKEQARGEPVGTAGTVVTGRKKSPGLRPRAQATALHLRVALFPVPRHRARRRGGDNSCPLAPPGVCNPLREKVLENDNGGRGGPYASSLCRGAGLRLRGASPHSTLAKVPPRNSAATRLQVRALGLQEDGGVQPPTWGGCGAARRTETPAVGKKERRPQQARLSVTLATTGLGSAAGSVCQRCAGQLGHVALFHEGFFLCMHSALPTV